LADQDIDNDDRTEEASQERREEFRERGQIAMSREVTSVFVLGATVIFLSAFGQTFVNLFVELFIHSFQIAGTFRVSQENALEFANAIWIKTLVLLLPVAAIASLAAAATTLAQTRLNWSWKKLTPDFNRMNPITGIARMMGTQSLLELFKGVAKLLGIFLVSYLILRGELEIVPALMNFSMMHAWAHWGEITEQLFWAVAGLLLLVGGVDYIYNWRQVEGKMRMTKQEVKEEIKKREVDPHVKGKMRRMQRDAATRKMLTATKTATVVVTNPTHFAVALKYEYGMAAPIVVAKGVDYIAQRIKEVAKENGVPMVEDKPLARTLYKMLEIGQHIPQSLYKAVSEVIRYVFQLKGIKMQPSRPQEGAR
jgi:flagellar biosynthesis protein FlhB